MIDILIWFGILALVIWCLARAPKPPRPVSITFSVIGGILCAFGVCTLLFNYSSTWGWTADYDLLTLAILALIAGITLLVVGGVLRKPKDGLNTGSIQANNDNNSTSMQNNSENNLHSAAKELGEWKELLDKGVITQEDFDLKKRELLNIGQKPHG